MPKRIGRVYLTRSSNITDRKVLRREIYGTTNEDEECYLIWGYGKRGTNILQSIMIALSVLGMGFQMAILVIKLNSQGSIRTWLATFLSTILSLGLVAICLLISLFRTRISIHPTLAVTYKSYQGPYAILYRSNRIKYVVASLLMATTAGLIMLGISLDGWNNVQVAAIIPAAILVISIVVFAFICEPHACRCCRPDPPMYDGLF
jgi:hypothetical protein